MTIDEIREHIRSFSTEEKQHILRFLEKEIEEAHFEDKFCGSSDEMIVDGKYFDENADDGKGDWIPVGTPRTGEH